MATTKPKQKPRSKTNEITLRGRSVWIDKTGNVTGKKGTRYSEVTTTIPFGTGWITAPTIDENGNKLNDAEVKQRLKDNQGKDFITGEKLPVFSSEEKASEYAEWRSSTMFDEEAIKEGFPEETFPDLPDDTIKKEKEKDSFLDYLLSPSKHGVFKKPKYNKGGTPMLEEQMELFNKGGLKDEGGEVDPESGNDVPIGSTKKEVRDDIPAMLSEGEFVFPADVVRYIGLEKLMELRQAAKMGLKKMEAMGQMGNSEEATIPDDMPFNMADLIIVSGEPEEDKPREMAEGGVVYANQGTFMPSTGIGGYQQSVFQNQPQVAAPYVPPSSVAPPPPVASPAGGYMPKFVTNNMTPFNDGSLPPPPNVNTNNNTSTSTGSGPAIEVPTVDGVIENVEYINPETGERRFFMHKDGKPVDPNSIPDGFILLKDYEAAGDETTTTDLESTSVGTAQVVDDGSADKKTLSDMVTAKKAEKANEFNRNFKEALSSGDATQLVDMYKTLKNQQTLLTGTGLLTGGMSFLAKPFVTAKQKELEAALANSSLGADWKNSEAIQAIDNMTFMDKVGSAFSSLVESFTTDDDKPYEAIYNTKDHPLGGGYSSGKGDNDNYSGAFGMLSRAEQEAYDNAVNMGNVNVANHYAIINHHRHLEAERGETSEGTKVNLAGTETPSGSGSGSNNNDNDNAPSHAEIMAKHGVTSNQAKTIVESASAIDKDDAASFEDL
jgi:hypothetical protein